MLKIRTNYNYEKRGSVNFVYDNKDVKVFNTDTNINPQQVNNVDAGKATFTNSSRPSKLFTDVTLVPFSPYEAQKFMNLDSSVAAPSADVVTNSVKHE